MGALADYLQNPYIIGLLVVWEMIWKGLALWKSAQKGQKYWFIAVLVINSMGLIPIIYLLFTRFSKKVVGQKVL